MHHQKRYSDCHLNSQQITLNVTTHILLVCTNHSPYTRSILPSTCGQILQSRQADKPKHRFRPRMVCLDLGYLTRGIQLVTNPIMPNSRTLLLQTASIKTYDMVYNLNETE